jgi:hypothetical protein
MGRFHLVSVATEDQVTARLADIAGEFEYNFKSFISTEQLSEDLGDNQIALCCLSAMAFKNQQEIAGHVQVIKQFSPDTYIVVIVGKKISADDVAFVKKSGANLILMENNFFETSEVEYLCSQIIRGSLIPIKPSDLKAGTEVDFKVLVIMPLNQKILPVVQPGNSISEGKYKKIMETKELYVQRDDLPKFQKYADKHQDLSAHGISARCRLQYLNLCRAHANLLFLLIDQGESASFTQGKQLLEDCDRLSGDLLSNLASVEDPWKVVNNSSIGESGSAERSTAIASMAGLMALQLDGISANEVVLAGLLSDFGLLDLHPKTLKKYRHGGLGALSSEEMKGYEQHPLASINKCLSRKLPLSEKTKNIIQCTHEKGNGKGFPKQVPGNRVPVESQVIHFCQLVDDKTVVKLGQAQRQIKDIQGQIFAHEFESLDNFRLDFLQKIKTIIA